MKELEKLRVILPHWIEHNIAHAGEFARWADSLRADGEQEIAELLHKAHSYLHEADAMLQEALSRAGGAMKEGGSHHHHH